MRRILPFSVIVLLLVTFSSSISADPPEAFVGEIFSINKIAYLSVPDGDVLCLTGQTNQIGILGRSRVRLTQTRGKHAVSFSIVHNFPIEDGMWSWTIPLYEWGITLKPGIATITEMGFLVQDLEFAYDVDIVLTGKSF